MGEATRMESDFKAQITNQRDHEHEVFCGEHRTLSECTTARSPEWVQLIAAHEIEVINGTMPRPATDSEAIMTPVLIAARHFGLAVDMNAGEIVVWYLEHAMDGRVHADIAARKRLVG
jgi:hypothetical protein